MRFRVLVLSPEFNVIRRMIVEAEDEFTAVDVVMFEISERRWDDPEATLDIKELSE